MMLKPVFIIHIDLPASVFLIRKKRISLAIARLLLIYEKVIFLMLVDTIKSLSSGVFYHPRLATSHELSPQADNLKK